MKYFHLYLLALLQILNNHLHAMVVDDCKIDNKVETSPITRGGIYRENPSTIFYPENVQDIQTIIFLGKKNLKKVRCIGSTHSLNPCSINDDYTISLDRLNHILEVGKDYCIVEAGIKIRDLCIQLEKHNLTLPILGAIAEQTIAGAAMTGTRGQGPSEGSLGSIIEEVELIDGNGLIHRFSKLTSPDMLYASVTSLGLLGVVTKVKIRCKPLFLMAETLQRFDYQETLNRIDEFMKYEKFVMYWNVLHDEIKVVTGHVINFDFLPMPLADFKMLGDYPHIHSLENFPPTFQRIGKSWQIHTLLEWPEDKAQRLSEKILKNEECIYQPEYSINKDYLIPFLEEIKTFFRKNYHRLNLSREKMVLEIRPVKKDLVWLSPSYGMDVFSVCFHDFKRGLTWDKNTASDIIELETLLKKYSIRPHLGKAHFFNSKELSSVFPKWDEFINLRKTFDPDNLFLTPYFEAFEF